VRHAEDVQERQVEAAEREGPLCDVAVGRLEVGAGGGGVGWLGGVAARERGPWELQLGLEFSSRLVGERLDGRGPGWRGWLG